MAIPQKRNVMHTNGVVLFLSQIALTRHIVGASSSLLICLEAIGADPEGNASYAQ